MHGHTFAAGHITDDRFAAYGIATARAINEQVALPLHADGAAVIATEDAAHHAADRGLIFNSGSRRFGFRSGCKFSQHLPR